MPAALVIQRPVGQSLLSLLGRERTAELERTLLRRALAWGRAFALEHTYQAGDSGRELAEAAAAGFERSGGGPLLVASAACATLSAAHTTAALADAAAGFDLSIGPASDGGWYMLALREPQPDILAAASHDLGGVLQVAQTAALTVGLLRSERELSTAAAAQALRLDPIVPPEVRSILHDY